MSVRLCTLALILVLVVCVYNFKQTQSIRGDLDNIERFIVSNEKQVNTPPDTHINQSDDDDDEMSTFDSGMADGFTPPPRGYSPQVNTTTQSKKKTTEIYDDVDDTDTYADELCNAPLLGSK